MVHVGRLQSRNLCGLVPAAQSDGGLRLGMCYEFLRFLRREWSPLHPQTGPRRRRQTLPVRRFRETQIPFRGDVQADGIDDFRREMCCQPVRARLFVVQIEGLVALADVTFSAAAAACNACSRSVTASPP
jgi:hypothetical protein